MRLPDNLTPILGAASVLALFGLMVLLLLDDVKEHRRMMEECRREGHKGYECSVIMDVRTCAHQPDVHNPP